MSKLKYIIAQVDIRNGEYEERATVKFKTRGLAIEVLDKIAQCWYDPENDGTEKIGDWYWHNGEVIVRAGSWEYVTEQQYKSLPWFISDMSDMDCLLT